MNIDEYINSIQGVGPQQQVILSLQFCSAVKRNFEGDKTTVTHRCISLLHGFVFFFF